MSTVDVDAISECAACGKGGDNLKACTACKLVKYCNVTCQKVHRPKHKKECKKRAAALFDEALFKQPPPKEDCPICFRQLPSTTEKTVYKSCCGNTVCLGCVYEIARELSICPFCRVPGAVSDEEEISRCKKRLEANDVNAFFVLGSRYFAGTYGLPQEPKKGLELWLRAVEIGSTEAHSNIACIYADGNFVEKDPKKALYHGQRAAMGGCETSRHDLGCLEKDGGNIERAMKHWMIAAATGSKDSLENIRKGFLQGDATKAEYEKALRAYQKYLDEVMSDQRETVENLIKLKESWRI
ncbi:hypothetical protein ACHAXR_009879 [Thalassiosira sp. AJA248-18]